MNTIHAPDRIRPFEFLQGDLLTDDDGMVYLLSTVASAGPKWVAICLQDGNRWSRPSITIDDAVDGLRFLGRDLVISFSDPKK